MIQYLLDTCICVELIRSKPLDLRARLKACAVGEVGISTITLAELQSGVFKSNDPSRNALKLSELCGLLQTLPFDDAAAAVYGHIRAELEQSGTPIGPLDTLIAAHAAATGAVLVTKNEKEFRRVRGLKVENWLRR